MVYSYCNDLNGLPSEFCKDRLPRDELKMVLEDESEWEYDVNYLGRKSALSGGWRGFAVDHKLDDGDAVVFEHTEPARFKVYIFRAFEDMGEAKIERKYAKGIKSLNSEKVKESDKDDETGEKDDDIDKTDIEKIITARERKPLNSKKARKSETNRSASQRVRRTRVSKKVAKAEDKEISELVDVSENNKVSISQEFLPECRSENVTYEGPTENEEAKKAVEFAKADHGSPPTKAKPKDKYFRKRSTAPVKFFRKRTRYC